MELNCEYYQFFGPPEGRHYTCLVTEVSIEKPKAHIDKVRGEHRGESTNKDVKSVHFTGLAAYIPGGLSAIFENLAFLTFYRCGLKSICRNDLKEYENLVGLFCDSNNLKSLPDDLFEGMTKLKMITFRDNYLEQISVKLFDPILKNGLTRVDFRNNRKINAVFGFREGNGITMDELITEVKKVNAERERESLLIEVENTSSKFGEDKVLSIANRSPPIVINQGIRIFFNQLIPYHHIFF